MPDDFMTKSAVSVTEMAAMVGLSRARFYQLVKKGTFPPPDYEGDDGRPFFSEDKQRQCLEVRRRNCGIDGKAILFYSRRRDAGGTRKKPHTPKPTIGQHAELIDGLKSLGLVATAAQVDAVVKELYPNGTAGTGQGEVIRAVFLRIRRQDSGGSDRR